MLTVLWTWLLTMFFGVGATITPVPIIINPGETLIHATKSMKPVDDAMRVGIDLGKATDDIKKGILNRSLTLQNIGKIEVEVCQENNKCLAVAYSGLYYGNDTYGVGFSSSGLQFKGASFVAVKIRTDKTLNNAVVSWSNYSQ